MRAKTALVLALVVLAPSAAAQFESLLASDLVQELFEAALGTSPATAVAAVEPAADFDVTFTSALDAQPAALTINGTAMTLKAQYDARDASSSSWPARTTGPTLSAAGSGTAPFVDTRSPFVDGLARTVVFNRDGPYNAGQYFASANGAITIGTEDLVLELVVRTTETNPTTDRAIIGNLSSSTGYGWGVFYRNGRSYALSADDDGVGGCFPSGSVTSNGDGEYNILHFTFDRSVGIRGYRNGNLITASACTTAATAAIDQTSLPFTIGSYGTLPLGDDSGVVMARVWSCPGCINTTAELDTLMLSRAAKLMGVTATLAASGTEYPQAGSRASSASMMLYRSSSAAHELVRVGRDWARVMSRDVSGTTFTGYLSEKTQTNLFANSEALNSWNAKAGDTKQANVERDPIGTFTADALDADTNNVEHYLWQNATGSGSFTTVSVFAKVGEYQHVALSRQSTANAYAWFNVSTCSTGTAQSAVVRSGTTLYADGWCRVFATYSASSGGYQISVAPADNTLAYADTGSASDMFFWGAQAENIPSPSTHIWASGTRAAETLLYTGTGNLDSTGYGTYEVLRMLNGPATLGGSQIIFSADRTSSPSLAYMRFYINGTTPTADSSTSLALAAGTESGLTSYRTRIVWQTNDGRMYSNGVLVASDNTVSLGSSIDRLAIGTATFSSGNQIISRARVWKSAIVAP